MAVGVFCMVIGYFYTDGPLFNILRLCPHCGHNWAAGNGAVQEKAAAAVEYCRHASDFTTKNNGKPWQYVIIPHNAVLANMGLNTLAVKYVYKNS